MRALAVFVWCVFAGALLAQNAADAALTTVRVATGMEKPLFFT